MSEPAGEGVATPNAQAARKTALRITKVWLDESREDCTRCGLCQDTCAAVFQVPDKMQVRPDADLAEVELIQEAAEHCPVSVIAFEIENSGKRDNQE